MSWIGSNWLMRLIILGLLVAFVAAAAAARLTFEVTTDGRAGPVDEPWAQDRMEFVAWNGEKWTAWIREGEFELVPEDTENWSRHSNDTLAFVGWNGEHWQARVDDEAFELAHRGNWQGDTQRAQAIRYRDWSGRNRLRTVDQLAR